jgi:8-amino-3,8-dideoxy-alpha-D-manno-octulosonate transaminase
MTELQAAMALAQLRKLDGIRAHCRALQSRILEQIEDLLAASTEIRLRHVPDPEGDSCFEIYLCLPDKERATEFRAQLNALNVNSSKTTGTYCHYAHEYCINAAAHAPSASPFARFEEWPAKGYREEDFPRTRDLADRFVALPLGVLYTPEDADYIARCVRQVITS